MDKFWVIRDGERVGPFDESEIMRSYEAGGLKADDVLVGEHGGPGARLGEVFSHLLNDILTSSELTLDPMADEPPPSQPRPPAR